MRNIYDYMNDIKTDTGSYTPETFTQLESKRWQKKVRRQIRGPRRQIYAACAAFAVLCLTALAAGPFKGQVNAAMRSASESISRWLSSGNWEKDVSPYETVVNTETESDGMEVKLESVILDDRQLMITLTQKYPDKMAKQAEKELESIKYNTNNGYAVYVNKNSTFDDMRKELKSSMDNEDLEKIKLPILVAEIYLNDEKVSGMELIHPVEEEDGKVRVVYECELESGKLDMSKEVATKIELQDAAGITDGKWIYEFKADGHELMADTTSVTLNQEVSLPDDKKITLTEYKHNEMGTYLYYKGDTKGLTLELRGKNDRGEIVWFRDYGAFEDGFGRFKLYQVNEVRAEGAQNMALSVYSPQKDEGKEAAAYCQYGEEFTIPTK